MIRTKKALLEAVVRYLLAHPEEILRALRNAAGLRFGLPLGALRWASQQLSRSDEYALELEAMPPGVRLGATVKAMGTQLRVSGVVYVDQVQIDAQQLRFDVRIQELSLKVLDDSQTALATLVRSGALDLSRPGNLIKFMPQRPAFLVEANDDRVVIDVMRHPALAGTRAPQLLALVTPLLTLSSIQTDWGHLDVKFTAFKDGLGGAWEALRARL